MREEGAVVERIEENISVEQSEGQSKAEQRLAGYKCRWGPLTFVLRKLYFRVSPRIP